MDDGAALGSREPRIVEAITTTRSSTMTAATIPSFFTTASPRASSSKGRRPVRTHRGPGTRQAAATFGRAPVAACRRDWRNAIRSTAPTTSSGRAVGSRCSASSSDCAARSPRRGPISRAPRAASSAPLRLSTSRRYRSRRRLTSSYDRRALAMTSSARSTASAQNAIPLGSEPARCRTSAAAAGDWAPSRSRSRSRSVTSPGAVPSSPAVGPTRTSSAPNRCTPTGQLLRARRTARSLSIAAAAASTAIALPTAVHRYAHGASAAATLRANLSSVSQASESTSPGSAAPPPAPGLRDIFKMSRNPGAGGGAADPGDVLSLAWLTLDRFARNVAAADAPWAYLWTAVGRAMAVDAAAAAMLSERAVRRARSNWPVGVHRLGADDVRVGPTAGLDGTAPGLVTDRDRDRDRDGAQSPAAAALVRHLAGSDPSGIAFWADAVDRALEVMASARRSYEEVSLRRDLYLRDVLSLSGAELAALGALLIGPRRARHH